MSGLRKGPVAVVLLVLGFCSAQTRRQDQPFCEPSSKSKAEIADADATILGFKIGTSTIKEVQAKLGQAKLMRVSREEESDISICYISPVDGTVLVFYTGVMGGGEDRDMVCPVVASSSFSARFPMHILERNIQEPEH